MDQSQVHPVVHAAAIAFGYVFMHPFDDGNGRIHRFLIHNILARRDFTPDGLIFPISAATLNNLDAYDVTKRAIQEIIDMPDQRIDLFIRFCPQNDGVISPKKCKSHFSELTDDEIEKMQTTIQKTYH
jgi:Fic family protein